MADTVTGAAVDTSRLDHLTDEALAIAEASRALLQASEGVGRGAPETPDLPGLVVAGEACRITSRVGFCLAWLLGRRAVLAGEITREAAAGEPWRLGGREICLVETPLPASAPVGLSVLLRRSADLYRRVDRLDRALDRVDS